MHFLRPYERKDWTSVSNLLSVLPSLYPNGAAWLDHRLDDVLWGKARCTLAISKGMPIGATIETPKGRGRIKLSTIFVHPSLRKFGVGTSLMRNCYENWVKENVSQVHLTVDFTIAPTLTPLLMNFGFVADTVLYDRYGIDRHELILSWSNACSSLENLGQKKSGLLRNSS